MSRVAPSLRECPYCKEEIRADAVKCKHCHSIVGPERPPHGGTCPYCKEEIKPEAVKCKHCGSMLDARPKTGPCGGCAPATVPYYGAFQQHPAARSGDAAAAPWLSAGSSIAGAPTCTQCFLFQGPFGIRGIQICCRVVWIPFLGVTNVCYPVPCYSAPGDVVIA